MSTSRKEKSLGRLCSRFVQLCASSSSPEVDLMATAESLGVERRRIYDVVNVLEALTVVHRLRKGVYHFNGLDSLRTLVVRLKNEINAGHWVGADPVVLPGDPQDAQKPRKFKMLTQLTREFLKIVVASPTGTIVLEPAAEQLLAMENKPVTESTIKNRTRRMYDVANVLEALGVVRRQLADAAKRRVYAWSSFDISSLGPPMALSPEMQAILATITGNGALPSAPVAHLVTHPGASLAVHSVLDPTSFTSAITTTSSTSTSSTSTTSAAAAATSTSASEMGTKRKVTKRRKRVSSSRRVLSTTSSQHHHHHIQNDQDQDQGQNEQQEVEMTELQQQPTEGLAPAGENEGFLMPPIDSEMLAVLSRRAEARSLGMSIPEQDTLPSALDHPDVEMALLSYLQGKTSSPLGPGDVFTMQILSGIIPEDETLRTLTSAQYLQRVLDMMTAHGMEIPLSLHTYVSSVLASQRELLVAAGDVSRVPVPLPVPATMILFPNGTRTTTALPSAPPPPPSSSSSSSSSSIATTASTTGPPPPPVVAHPELATEEKSTNTPPILAPPPMGHPHASAFHRVTSSVSPPVHTTTTTTTSATSSRSSPTSMGPTGMVVAPTAVASPPSSTSTSSTSSSSTSSSSSTTSSSSGNSNNSSSSVATTLPSSTTTSSVSSTSSSPASRKRRLDGALTAEAPATSTPSKQLDHSSTGGNPADSGLVTPKRKRQRCLIVDSGRGSPIQYSRVDVLTSTPAKSSDPSVFEDDGVFSLMYDP